MSFFGDLKTITKASIKAVGDSVELLAEVAEGVERSSARLLLHSRAKNLERDFNREADGGAGRWKLQDIWEDLSEIYDELWQGSTNSEQNEIAKKRKQCLARISAVTIDELESDIAREKSRIAKTTFMLPIREISALNRLNAMQKRLAALVRNSGATARSQELAAESRNIEFEIAELEKKRSEMIVEYYSAGDTKRFLPKRDGELDGTVQCWYRDGAKEYQIEFSDGGFTGEAKYWREDGSLLCEVKSAGSGTYKHQLFLGNGQKIGDCSLTGNQGFIFIWYWDGYYLGRATVSDGNVGKVGIILSIFLKPGFWLRIYRAGRSSEQLNKVKQMNDAAMKWNMFGSEINLLGKG